MALPCQKNSLRWCGARPTRKLQPVKAELISRGRALLPKSLTVDRNMLGEGSFGQVFMGSWRSATGDTKVVLKRVKAKVEGALAMGQMELLLNAYAGKVAKAHCAEFLGYCEVAAEEATSRLTSGLWLVWKYEGSRTLAYYLRRRDTLRALASDMEIPEEAVVATAIKQLCEGLAAFHAAGLVHRDVKPQNIIFADDVKRLKLIDLGACADLRTGTNYVPDESILDPNYCPPEQYVLPTDSPHLAKSMLRLAISPMLWAQHKPDRFDTWSAGVCMLQLAVPSMRQDRGLRNFNTIFSTKCSYDLAVWRTMSYIPAREFEVLDADDGAGWDLVRMLLRPRSIKTLQDGTVVFVNDNSQQRLSAGEALRHRFMKQAAEPGSIFIESGANSSGSYSGSSSSSGSGPAQRSTGARGGLRIPAAAAAAAAGSSGQSSSGSGGSNALRRGPAGRQSTAAGSGQKSQGQGQGSAATGAGSQSGSFEAAVGLWRNLTGKLFDLEANIVMTASATELQTGLVKQLKKKVVKGQASADALRQEEVKLSGMEQQLGTLQDDFNKTASAVGNVLSFLGFGGQSQGSAPAGATGPRSSSSGSSGSKQALVDSSQAGRVSKPPSTPTKLAPQHLPKSGAGGLWASVQDRMSSLEQQFSNQVAATERQSLEVRRLKQELSRGVVEEAAVARAEELLQRMERRLSKLDQDVATQRQTTPGFFSMFGNFGATPPAEAPPPAAAPAPAPEPAMRGAPSSSPAATAASSAPAPAAAGSKPTAPTGFGGLLSRMFGGGRSGNQKTNALSATAPATSAIPEQQQQQQQLLVGSQRAAPAPRGRTAPVPVRGASVEVIAAQTSNLAVAAAQVGAGQAMVQGAGSLLATSLKFTGLAAKVGELSRQLPDPCIPFTITLPLPCPLAPHASGL
ncbi:kinase-like domain-containing protein [Haematococcus lacustris]